MSWLSGASLGQKIIGGLMVGGMAVSWAVKGLVDRLRGRK